MKSTLSILVVLLASAVPTGAGESKPVRVVQSLDLNRYMGKWYEIARYPNRFQRDCAGSVSATYTLRKDGKVRVLNECKKADGKVKSAKGTAKLADKATS